MPRWTPDGLKPIVRVNLASPAVASYSFNAAAGLDLTNYRAFVFELEGIRTAADGGDLYLRTSGNSGATDYENAGQIWASTSSFTSNTFNAGSPQIRLTVGGLGSVAANEYGVSGTVKMTHGGNSGIVEPCFEYSLQYRDANNVMLLSLGRACRKNTTQITSVDFLSSDAANFEQGEISIYGIRRIS